MGFPLQFNFSYYLIELLKIEMVLLTENLVVSKARADSLSNVKNLNLWGNDLTDVSVLQRVPNIEVLSLSLNRISSLKDFQYCK